MTSRYYSSIAQDTTLTSGITSGVTSMTVSGTTGWPTTYPFTLAVDFGSAIEELVDVTNVSGLTVTIIRGIDSTTPTSHGVGAVVRHVISARDVREANVHINSTTTVHGIADTSVLATQTDIQNVVATTFLTMGS